MRWIWATASPAARSVARKAEPGADDGCARPPPMNRAGPTPQTCHPRRASAPAPRRELAEEADKIPNVQDRRHRALVAVGARITRGEQGLEAHKVVDVQDRRRRAAIAVGPATRFNRDLDVVEEMRP